MLFETDSSMTVSRLAECDRSEQSLTTQGGHQQPVGQMSFDVFYTMTTVAGRTLIPIGSLELGKFMFLQCFLKHDLPRRGSYSPFCPKLNCSKEILTVQKNLSWFLIVCLFEFFFYKGSKNMN